MEISADENTYYLVGFRPKDENWSVTRYSRHVIGGGTSLGSYATADEAVSYVKSMLSERRSELDDALEQLD